ncbi:MAG: hypothetical protein R3F07_02125 [Opitutaceae bacterium]
MNPFPDNTSPNDRLAVAVALFVFNRPDYTRRVLEVLRMVRPADVFLVADGPRADQPDDAARCLEVRNLLEEGIDWPCRVQRKFADTNLGCGERIASGLAWVFGQVDRAIILEDDCLPETSFFPFCQELLERFSGDQRIGMIAGTNYRLKDAPATGSYFFTRHHSIWGWATWRRALTGYDPTMKAWRDMVSVDELETYWEDRRSRLIHREMFDLYREGPVDTWDIPWVFHLVRNRMLSVVPRLNQVRNIGTSGTRGRGDDRNNNLPTYPLPFPLHHPESIKPDPAYDRFVSKRHRLVRDWMRARWTRRVRDLLKPL